MRNKSVMFIVCIAMLLALMPQMAFATEADSVGIETYGASQSVQGVLAGRYYENGQFEYEPITNMSSVMNMNGINPDGTFYMGIWKASGFERGQDIDSAELIITKDGAELARETLTVGSVPQLGAEIDGLNYGILCRTDDTGKVKKLSGRVRFDLSTDAFHYYTKLAGIYNLTINWTADGTRYTATMNCSLTQGKMFSSIEPEGNENGVLTTYWGWAQDATKTVSFDFNPLKSYSGEHWNPELQEQVDGEITKRFVYTDSSMDGVFDFVGCSTSTSGFEKVFVQGVPIRFDENSAVTPLCVHPHFITENMIGSTCTLTFKKGNVTRTVTIRIDKEDMTFLKSNIIYAVNLDSCQSIAAAGDGTVKLCCRNEAMEYLLKDSEQLSMGDRTGKYIFVRYQNGKLVSVQMQAPTGSDAQKLGFSLESSDNGIYTYLLQPLKKGTVSLKAVSNDNLRANCEIDFPSAAFFTKRERTEEAFRTELHYIDAVERGSGEASFYLMTPKEEWIDQSALKISFLESYRSSNGQWTEREYDEEGIRFTPDGTYYDAAGKANFFVWKVTITDKFDDGGERYNWKNLCIYDESGLEDDRSIYSTEYSYHASLTIFDATEIPAEQKLYWFYKNSNITIQNGKLVLMNAPGSLDLYARDSFSQRGVKDNSYGYFAVKKGNDYCVIDTPVSSDAQGKVIISQAENGSYKIKWRNTGKYLASTNFEGKEYFLKMTIALDNTGFYTKNEPDERWLLDTDIYFSDAVETSEDKSEAYFYLISDEWDIDATCKPVFVEWQSGSSEDGYDSGYVETAPVGGISFGDVQILKVGSKQYYSWKMTISNKYQEGYSNSKIVGFKKGDEILQSAADIEIFGVNAPQAVCGNVNGDNRESADTADVLYLKRYLAGWNGYDDVEKRTADVNRDGLIDSADAMILERHVSGWTGFEQLPYKGEEVRP